MVVETESALRHQTLSHFIHTFIQNYDREAAADRTMRSQYVPRNIKLQLLAAIRECETRNSDADRTAKISSIADMGLFIDASCNEIVYYHSITSSVLQWTLSLYVHDAHVRNVIKTVLDDMGRVGDEDIQFILEKYRYNEERRLAGDPPDRTGVDKILSFLKPKKFQPGVSYFSYYTQSVMLKLARSLLQNSASFFNSGGDVFCIGRPAETTVPSRRNSVDAESEKLYDDYKQHREILATMNESESLDKMRELLKHDTTNGNEMSMREPPESTETVFDQPYSSEDEISDDGNNEEVDKVVYTVESPPLTREDREVEEILKQSLMSDANRSTSKSGQTVKSLNKYEPGLSDFTVAVANEKNCTEVSLQHNYEDLKDPTYMDAFLGGAGLVDMSDPLYPSSVQDMVPYSFLAPKLSELSMHSNVQCSKPASINQTANVSDVVVQRTTMPDFVSQQATSYTKRVARNDSGTTMTTTIRRIAMSQEMRSLLKRKRMAKVGLLRNPTPVVPLKGEKNRRSLNRRSSFQGNNDSDFYKVGTLEIPMPSDIVTYKYPPPPSVNSNRSCSSSGTLHELVPLRTTAAGQMTEEHD